FVMASNDFVYEAFFGSQPDGTFNGFGGYYAVVLGVVAGPGFVPVDIYGEPGNFEPSVPWAYTQGWALRDFGAGPSATFDIGQWDISSVGALGDCEQNAECTDPFPIDTYGAGANPCGLG